MTRFYSEILGRHDRAAFTSGHDRIDGYFHRTVSQDVKRNYAACYVLVERESGHLAGFYTLSASQIPLTGIPPDMARKLPRYPTVPAVLIGWLARDLAFRGQDIGSLLLRDAMARVSGSAIGAYAVFADAIDDAAAAFYSKYQFTPLCSRPSTLFLPLSAGVERKGSSMDL